MIMNWELVKKVVVGMVIKQNFMEKLLDGVEVEWKSLSDIATITIGDFVHKNNQDSSAKYPVYNGGISPTGYYEKSLHTTKKSSPPDFHRFRG